MTSAIPTAQNEFCEFPATLSGPAIPVVLLFDGTLCWRPDGAGNGAAAAVQQLVPRLRSGGPEGAENTARATLLLTAAAHVAAEGRALAETDLARCLALPALLEQAEQDGPTGVYVRAYLGTLPLFDRVRGAQQPRLTLDEHELAARNVAQALDAVREEALAQVRASSPAPAQAAEASPSVAAPPVEQTQASPASWVTHEEPFRLRPQWVALGALAVLPILALVATHTAAPGTGDPATIKETFTGMQSVIASSSFMVGLVLSGSGLLCLKQAVDSGGQDVKFSDGLVRLVVGAGLTALPSLLGSVG